MTLSESEKTRSSGRRTVFVRMKNELVEALDNLAEKTGRSRNNVINILLLNMIDKVIVPEES